MFTGIVQGLGTVVGIVDRPGLRTLAVECPGTYFDGLQTGASVAVDGVCLTVTRVENSKNQEPNAGATFDVMSETLEKTTVGSLREGSRVNVERSCRVGDEVGGHVVSGHVTGTAEIASVERSENNCVTTFRVPNAWMKYVLPKGFVAIDGCSLTVVDVDRRAGTFTVALIPETLARTTFGFKGIGDRANLEIDSRTQAIVDTVEAYLAGKNF
jgi:riboflavin synthase